MTTPRQRTPRKATTKVATVEPPTHELARLVAGEHPPPHNLLGAHPATVGRTKGLVIRALAPDAERCDCVLADGTVVEMPVAAKGNANCFAVFLPKATFPIDRKSTRLNSSHVS